MQTYDRAQRRPSANTGTVTAEHTYRVERCAGRFRWERVARAAEKKRFTSEIRAEDGDR